MSYGFSGGGGGGGRKGGGLEERVVQVCSRGGGERWMHGGAMSGLTR